MLKSENLTYNFDGKITRKRITIGLEKEEKRIIFGNVCTVLSQKFHYLLSCGGGTWQRVQLSFYKDIRLENQSFTHVHTSHHCFVISYVVLVLLC